jgi:hypothetical protein
VNPVGTELGADLEAINRLQREGSLVREDWSTLPQPVMARRIKSQVVGIISRLSACRFIDPRRTFVPNPA